MNTKRVTRRQLLGSVAKKEPHDAQPPCRKSFWWSCRIVRLVILVGLLGIAAWGCGGDVQPARSSTHAATSQSPDSLPRILELGADACVPCRKMVPVLDALEKEYQGRLEVQSIDVFKYPKMAEEYGVQSVPVQIFYDALNNELYRHEGFLAKEDILKKWRDLGVDLTGNAVEQ